MLQKWDISQIESYSDTDLDTWRTYWRNQYQYHDNCDNIRGTYGDFSIWSEAVREASRNMHLCEAEREKRLSQAE